MNVDKLLAKDERRHPEPTCKYLASRRNEYRNIPFDELLPLALYTTVADLQRLASQDVKHLARIASQRYTARKGDFVKALYKYCKSLDSPLQQATALLEGSMHLVEKAIEVLANSASPATAGWEHWILVSRTLLQCLLPVGDSASDEDWGFRLSRVAVSALQHTLGNFLCVGFNTSSMRIQEAGKDLTEAACVYMPSQVGEDFKLDIQIGHGTGLTISQLLSAGDDLREVLGTYLYDATRSSKIKPAVRLSWIEMGCKLELIVGFEAGLTISNIIVPSY